MMVDGQSVLNLLGNADGSVTEGPYAKDRAKNWMRDMKDIGNQYFTKKDYEQAESMYKTGILQFLMTWGSDNHEDLDEEVKTMACQLLTNRSLCRYEQRKFGESLADAQLAVKVDPTNFKGYYRCYICVRDLGDQGEAMKYILPALRKGQPSPVERCRLIAQGLKMSEDIEPELPSPLALMLGLSYNPLPFWSDLISLIQNESQWRRVFSQLSSDKQWPTLHKIHTVVESTLINGKSQVASGVKLSGLVRYTELTKCSWGDQLAIHLIDEGSPCQTLSVNGDPPVFGALKLGLSSDVGKFQTLRHYLEIVIVRDQGAKNAKNSQKKSLMDVVVGARVDTEIKEAARRILTENGVGRTDKEPMDGNLAALNAVRIHDEGVKLLKDGDVEGANRFYTKAISLIDSRNPTHHKALLYLNRSTAFLCMGRHNDAIRDLKEVLKLQPNHSEANDRLEDLYRELKQYKDRTELLVQMFNQTSDQKKKTDILQDVCKSVDRPNDYRDLSEAVKKCEASLAVWTAVIKELYNDHEYRILIEIFSIDKYKQGDLALYKADKMNLSQISNAKCSGRSWLMTERPLCIILLEWGARLTTLIPMEKDTDVLIKKLIKGRPIVYIFIQSVLALNSDILDYLLDRPLNAQTTTETNSDLFSRLIIKYKSLPVGKRCLLLARIHNIVAGDAEPDWTEILKALSDKETYMYKNVSDMLITVQ